MPSSPVPAPKGPSRAPHRPVSLRGMVPIKVMSLGAVFQEFVSIGRVRPDEQGRFTEYVTDLSPFVQKGILRLATSRFAPFEKPEIKALETDTIHLEKTLNSYLRYSAKSEAASSTWYERRGTKMQLALQISFPGDKQPSGEGEPKQA